MNLERKHLDPEALEAAYQAVRQHATTALWTQEVLVIAITAYMNDLLRQVGQPCNDCKEDHEAITTTP